MFTRFRQFLNQRAEERKVIKGLRQMMAHLEAQNRTKGETPLHFVAAMGYRDEAEILLKRRAKVKATNCEGNTPLHFAALKGRLEIVNRLLFYGADINVKNSQGGLTPLHVAAHAGHTDVVERLIASGAHVNAKDDHGQTPLRHATNGNVRVTLSKHGGVE